MSNNKTVSSADILPNANRVGHSNLVIGLTGPFGSGCSEMRKVLKDKFGFRDFKISDEIREEVGNSGKKISKGEPGWRKVLQEHGNEKRKDGRAYWIDKAISKIDKAQIGNQDIVIDGFRNFQEVQEFRKIYPRFFLVAICAEKNKRWQRVRDDYGGRYNEFEEDDRRDKNQDFEWGQSVQKCVDDADYVFYNNENLTVTTQDKTAPDVKRIIRTLEEQARDFVPLMKGETQVRPPRPEEIQVLTAYAQSNSSTCKKRHVGAAITITKNNQEFVVSTGYNENPGCIQTCLIAGACYKDENMESKLIARGKKIYCPSCGQEHINLTEPWNCKNKNCGASIKDWLHPNRNMELCTAVHAEERALLSLSGRSAKDGTLYVTTFPCFQCARLILDAEIKKIVFVEAYPVSETSDFLKQFIDIKPFTGFTARAFFRVFPKVN